MSNTTITLDFWRRRTYSRRLFGYNRPMLRFVDLANAITILSLGCGLACALLAIRQRMAFALIALIVAGLCDLFDGLVARRLSRTDEQRHFGGRLDSLVDACSFGFAPAILLFAIGRTSPAEMLAVFLLPICAVWRLAYFDATTPPGNPPRFHEGMPTTYVALFLPLGLLIGHLSSIGMRSAAVVTAVVLSVAMVCRVRIPKPRGIAYAIFLVAGVAAIVAFAILGGAHGQLIEP
jgi:CDP-diacylglycerol--serine O-phosphatidyltransferase